MPEQPIPADPHARRKLVALCLVVHGVFLLATWAISFTLPDPSAPPSEFVAAVDRHSRLSALLMGVVSLLWVGGFVYFARVSRATNRSGAFPPLGVRLPYSTLPRSGARARAMALWYTLYAVVCLAVGICAFYAALRSFP